jgi:hypothetical protein
MATQAPETIARDGLDDSQQNDEGRGTSEKQSLLLFHLPLVTGNLRTKESSGWVIWAT